MASMDRDEVSRRLQKMIDKAERKGQTKKRFALICALECRKYTERIGSYGDCNTCHAAETCKMRPEWGGFVRINCPYYTGSDVSEPWRESRQ